MNNRPVWMLENTIVKVPGCVLPVCRVIESAVLYLWWRGERKPPHRSGSCVDSVSSATCTRPAGSKAPLVCISWTALGWCGTQWRPLLAGSVERKHFIVSISTETSLKLKQKLYVAHYVQQTTSPPGLKMSIYCIILKKTTDGLGRMNMEKTGVLSYLQGALTENFCLWKR